MSFFVYVYTLGLFMHICLHLDDVITPGSRPLQGLIDYVAFLVQSYVKITEY